MAAHESPRTTKLYNRPGDEITLDEVERIRIEGRPYARAHIVSEYDEFIVGQTFETVNPLILSVVKFVPQLRSCEDPAWGAYRVSFAVKGRANAPAFGRQGLLAPPGWLTDLIKLNQ